MEGMSRPAFRIARELTQNSRSGLTVRFLSKKLELPQEEIEYLIDVNHKLFFSDLTKVKLVVEGYPAVKRIADGLENFGDVPSLHRRVKALSPHDFRLLEEHLGINKPGGKKAAAEFMVDAHYSHPDSIVEYVAGRGFSPMAQEVFDIIWQSKEGVMPVSRIRAAHSGSEYDVEQALHELFRGFAAFELFRFDSEDRLVRAGGLLAELRQWREKNSSRKRKKSGLKAIRGKVEAGEDRGMDLSDRVCQLVAAIAAKPARLRGDGDLFREDFRRLSDVVSEEAEPSLSTCLWLAEGAQWLVRVDNELRAGELDALIELNRVERHRILFDWLASRGNETQSRRMIARTVDGLKPGGWYPTLDYIDFALDSSQGDEKPTLKNGGAHWLYASPGAGSNSERGMARSLEETYFWLGLVARSDKDGDSIFQLTDLGRYLLSGKGEAEILQAFPMRETEIVVQPNFDIVVPTQNADPLLTVPLDQFADRQSSGTASVYHLSKDSFTRGIQEGHDGEAFVEFLLAHNRGGSLPANVTMTLDDWGGGMKRIRVRTVHVLESDDPLVIADLMHRRRFQKFFSSIDPNKMVLYGNITKSELAKTLEKEGFVIG
jgi:hypothetical protein